MPPRGDQEACSRCRRVVAQRSRDFAYGEFIDGDFVCEECLTGEEAQAIADDFMEFDAKMRQDEIAEGTWVSGEPDQTE